MIKSQSYSISNQMLNSELLSLYINTFWDEIFSPLILKNADKHLMLMVKVSFNDPKFDYSFRTLGHLRRVNHNEQELFTEYLSERLSILNESYVSSPIDNIRFNYVERDGLAPEEDRRLLQNVSDNKLTFHRFNNMELPITMIVEEYGIIIATTHFDTFTRFIVVKGNRTYQIDVSLNDKVNNVTILGASDLKWTDVKINGGFKRIIGKSTKYFLDGVNVLNKQILNAKPFKILNPDRKIGKAFVTMDIETINQNGNLIPYLICAYNGKDYITSYTNSTLDQVELFNNFIYQLISKSFNKHNNLIVYAHNLGGFDGIFLMKQLIVLNYKFNPVFHNNKIIAIRVTILGNSKNEIKTIIFKDSYLLLPYSLRKLCESFNVVTSKGYFPFLLSNIFYTGIIPKFELWTGLNLQEYGLIKGAFKNKMWSFQEESIKYCKLDCLSLHEILVKFNELVYNEFKINIHTPLTLPALAMRIYKTHFMPENTIYQILGKPENFIRESYTGGAVDVYIPHNRISAFFSNIKTKFITLFYYDVNSLYPSVMSNTQMPIGKPISFEGNIRHIEPEAFGFFYCKITSPDNILHPLLQRRIKTSDGIRTIAGLGSWEGWVCSSEMDNAVKFGYTFEILKGYQFETGDLFSGYVTKMYNLRLEYSKTHAMNLIAKLLMNSLYGKFGMKLDTTEISMYDTSTDEGLNYFKEIIDLFKESITDYIQIEKTFLIVRNTKLSLKYDEDLEMFHGLDVNIAIASAITAGARVHMSFFKNNPNFNLYYSDTDSAVIDKALPENFVGNKIGQLKLENTLKRAVFLAPKVYGFIDGNGNQIIKIKGINQDNVTELKLTELENLLVKDSTKEFTQEKWFKKMIEGEISITDIAYTLKVTSNKRMPIYLNNDGIFIYNIFF